MASLILVIGLPASGKSTYAAQLAGIHIDMNHIEQGVTGEEPPSADTTELIHHLTQRSVHFYLSQDKTVILDAPLLTRLERTRYIAMAKKMNIPTEVHWLDTSLPLLQQRLQTTRATVANEQLTQALARFDMPLLEEGMEVLHYHGDVPSSTS